MLKILLIALGLVFARSAFAADYRATVYLRDGTLVEGVIFEETPEAIKIRTADQRWRSIARAEIDKIDRAATPAPAPAAASADAPSVGTARILDVTLGLIGFQGVGQIYMGDVGKGFAFMGAGLLGAAALALGIGTAVGRPNGNKPYETAIGVGGGILFVGSFVWSLLDLRSPASSVTLVPQSDGLAVAFEF